MKFYEMNFYVKFITFLLTEMYFLQDRLILGKNFCSEANRVELIIYTVLYIYVSLR